MVAENTLTIGELARRGNVSTSLLRYYEKEGLLEPVGRTEAGYRLYAPDAVRHLRFIRKAQRYGFSLNDIKLMRGAAHDEGASGRSIRDIAEQRFVDIERRVTEMLVLRHELELFLDDIAEQIGRSAGPNVAEKYRKLLEDVCGHEHAGREQSSLQKLTERLGCNIATAEWEDLFEDLRGEHVHVWREDDEDYSVLYSNTDPKIVAALERLAAAESGCEAHSEPEVVEAEGGILFRARGSNAFLFAQLFLALESAAA
jgi:DNA-binding transcriptional MerR regulator